MIVMLSVLALQSYPPLPLSSTPSPPAEVRAGREVRQAIRNARSTEGEMRITGALPSAARCSLAETTLPVGGSKSVHGLNMANFMLHGSGEVWRFRIQKDHLILGKGMYCLYRKHPDAPPLPSGGRMWGDVGGETCTDYDDAFWSAWRAECIKP